MQNEAYLEYKCKTVCNSRYGLKKNAQVTVIKTGRNEYKKTVILPTGKLSASRQSSPFLMPEKVSPF